MAHRWILQSLTLRTNALYTGPLSSKVERGKNTMKNTWLRFLAVPAIAGGMLLAAVPEVSQQPNPAAEQRAQRLQKRGDRIARFLNLSDTQKAQFTADWQASRASARPIHSQLHQLRQEMFQAVR